MFKGLFLPEEFNKCVSLFPINLQETFVNLNKVFELKNYFVTLFQFKMSCSICNYSTIFFNLNIPCIPVHCRKQ